MTKDDDRVTGAPLLTLFENWGLSLPKSPIPNTRDTLREHPSIVVYNDPPEMFATRPNSFPRRENSCPEGRHCYC